jgi:hypothetical protein
MLQVFADASDAPATLSAPAGATIRFVTHADDPSGGDVSYSLEPASAPAGARVNARTGLFTFNTRSLGLAPGDAPVTVPVTIVATASNGLSASRELALVVNPSSASSSAAAPPAPAADAPSGAATSSEAAATPVGAPPAADSSAAPATASLADDSSAAANPRAATRTSGGGLAASSEISAPRKKKSGLDGGAIAGIVIAVLITAAMGALAALKWRTRRVRAVAERHIRLAEF